MEIDKEDLPKDFRKMMDDLGVSKIVVGDWHDVNDKYYHFFSSDVSSCGKFKISDTVGVANLKEDFDDRECENCITARDKPTQKEKKPDPYEGWWSVGDPNGVLHRFKGYSAVCGKYNIRNKIDAKPDKATKCEECENDKTDL